jgi:hypothetical protein
VGSTSPQTPGTPISFTASATGGSGTPEYTFYWKNPVSGIWTSTDYSTTAIWNWDTTNLPLGVYDIQVWARNVGAAVAYEAWTTLVFTLE